MSATGVIGIDLGSTAFLIAAAKRGNVEVLVNESNYRQTPTLITYGAERAVGDAALNHVKRELRNSVHMSPRLLGDLFPRLLDDELFFNYAPIRRETDGTLRISVRGPREALELVPEQVVGAIFSKVKQLLALNNSGCSTLVVAVPSYFGPVERQAMLDSARIAGLEISLLINESSAVLLSYGIFRKGELEAEKPRMVVFADVGHAKTSLFLTRVFRDSAEVLFEKTDRSLGVREIDRLLFSFYAEKVLEKFGRSVSDFPKAKLRLLEAIERQRKVLSANAEAGISLDCFIEERDFSYSLRREEYLSLCAPVLDRFQQFFLLAREELGDALGELHSVEKVGGGSRIPAIEKIIAVAFGIETLAKTLDAGECVVRGTAIRAAMVSPMFRVADFAIKDRLGMDVRARLQYESDPNPKDALLFPRNSEAGKVLSVNLSKNERLLFQLYYPVEGGERLLLSGEVERANPRSDVCEAKLFFAVDNNLLVRVDKAEIRETLPGESGDRIETRQLALSTRVYYGLSPEAMSSCRALEQKFIEDEQALFELQNTKYALETFVYKTREKINDCGDLASSAEKKTMLEVLESTQNWLYDEGDEVNIEQLKSRLDAIKLTCRPLLQRSEVLKDLADYLPETRTQMQRLIEQAKTVFVSEKRNSFEKALQAVNEQLSRLDEVLVSRKPASVDATNYAEVKRLVSVGLADAEKELKRVEHKQKEEAQKKSEPKEEPIKPDETPES